jgi:DNA mismatch endonuclease, patch repair protein
MADIWTKRKRSEVMSLIRSHGNKATELRLIEVFQAYRITGWRRKQTLFGNPDFIFRKERVCIFVDGCFWHNCPKHGTQPAMNRLFWSKKLQRNIVRDRLVNLILRKNGWRVLRVWQHELTKKNEPRLASRLRRLIAPSTS